MDIASQSSGVLSNAAYRHFVASRMLSSFAFQGMTIALGWLVYDTTRNPFDLGLIGLCQFLPMVVLPFVVGQVADRFDRRRIGLVCQLLEALVALVFALGIWQGWLTVPLIFVGVAVLGAFMRRHFQPTTWRDQLGGTLVGAYGAIVKHEPITPAEAAELVRDAATPLPR